MIFTCICKKKHGFGAAYVQQQSQHCCGKLDPTVISNVSALFREQIQTK